jgi:hypothetical protein
VEKPEIKTGEKHKNCKLYGVISRDETHIFLKGMKIAHFTSLFPDRECLLFCVALQKFCTFY